jgi:hypothetical protein
VAVAAVSALGQGNSSGVGTTTLTTGATVTAGHHLILVAGRFNSTNSTMSVSGGGLTWTEDVTLVSGSYRISIFRAPAPSGLASGTTLTVTHTGGGTADCIIAAHSYSGIDTAGTVIATGSHADSATTAWGSGAVASTSGNALIGGSFSDGAAVSSTPTSPGVERYDINIGAQSECLELVDKVSVAGSDSIDGTWNASTTSISAAVCYKATAAVIAPPASRPRYRRLVRIG